MPERLLQLEDVRNAQNPEKIAVLFRKLGYNASAEPLLVEALELPPRSAEAVVDAYLIAHEKKDELWVYLFQLHPTEFSSESDAKSRMRAIAENLCKNRICHFLLLGTKDYKQLLLVNPQKDKTTLKVSVNFWYIDLRNPTVYNRHRLENIAANSTTNKEKLHQIQCEAFASLKQEKQHTFNPNNEDSIRRYLQEIGKFKLLTSDDELELGREVVRLQELEAVRDKLAKELGRKLLDDEWANKVGMELEDFKSFLQALRKAKEKMIVSNLRLVVFIAKKYLNRGVDFLDLIQEGNLGLIRAVERFDPNKGYKFYTYATWWIRQAVTRAIHKYSRIIKLPINIWEKISKIKKASKHLCQENGRKPTQAEVANYLEMTVIELQDIRKYAQKALSLDIETGDEKNSTFMELIPSNEETPQEQIERQDIEKVLRDTLIDDHELDVIRRRYGLDDGKEKTLKKIGNDLNLNPERIRKIENQALRKLRVPFRELDLLGPIHQVVEKPIASPSKTEGLNTSNGLQTAAIELDKKKSAVKLNNNETTPKQLYQAETQKVVAIATNIEPTYNIGYLNAMNYNSAELKEKLQALKNHCLKVVNNFFEEAESLGVLPPPQRDNIVDFSPLESLLSSIEKAEEERSRVTEIRQQALTVLERALAITHRDNSDFQPLLECQKTARELKQKISESVEVEADAKTQTFSELLNLIEGADELDDNRLTELQDSVAKSFARTLATAALRGKLQTKPILEEPFSSSLKNVAVTVPSPVEDCQQQFVVEPPVLGELLVEVPTLLSTTETPKDSNNQDLVASTENKEEEVQLVGKNRRKRVRGEIP